MTKTSKEIPVVSNVEETSHVLSDKAGINAFARYLRSINIIGPIFFFLSFLRKSAKGASIYDLINQILCNFALGTARSLSHFDVLKNDEGYAAAIETNKEDMVSSHTVKRFYKAIPNVCLSLFRTILQRLFVWRLNIEKPDVIIANIDAMVMDNNDATQREGVECTYKKVCGFAPLQMTWGRYIIDAIFRSGSKHSNHEDDTISMIQAFVKNIRGKYDPNVPIIIRMDSGFCDQKLFRAMEDLDIGYIVGGVFHPDVKSLLGTLPDSAFQPHFGKKEEDIWEFFEYGDRRASWPKDEFRRVVFYRPLLNEKRWLLPISRPGTAIYTNLGRGYLVDNQLKEAGYEHLILPDEVIRSYQQRGADELVHRSLKEFGYEQLPFQSFRANTAVYFMMLIAFFIFEAFKVDVGDTVLPPSATPTTFRNKLINIVGQFIKHSGKITLKVTASVMRELNFKVLWERSLKALPIP